MSRLAAFLVAGLSLPVLADGGARFASFTMENDFFAGYDRHYTNGLQLAFVTPVSTLPTPIRSLPPLRWTAEPDVVLAIGQRIYTPTDTDREDPDPADRPYAGWLYMLADVQARGGDALDHVTVTLGVVGPASLARQTQDAFHHVTNTQPVRGWDAQLRNEPAFTIGFERAWPKVVRGMQGWYAWAGADGRAVARNVFIDGNTFRDGPGVKRRPLGYDLQLGIAAVWPTLRASFTFVQRGREFEGQPSPDRFGQLALSLPY